MRVDPLRALVCVGLLGLLAWQSHAQMARWQDDRALWASAVALAPLKPRPTVNLAAAMILTDVGAARMLAERALELSYQPWVPAHQREMTAHVVAFNVFQIALVSGRTEEIIPAYERLARLWPEGILPVRVP